MSLFSNHSILNCSTIDIDGLEVIVGNHQDFDFSGGDVAGVLFQYPNTNGIIEDFEPLVARAKEGKVENHFKLSNSTRSNTRLRLLHSPSPLLSFTRGDRRGLAKARRGGIGIMLQGSLDREMNF